MPLILIGCAQPVTTIIVPEIVKSEAIVLKDLRPDLEKQNEILSLLVTSDAYGIYRKGDASTVPAATRLLQHRVFEKFNTSNQPKEITIHHLVVYLNMQSSLRRTAIMAGFGGVVGSAIAGGTQNNSATLSCSLIEKDAFEAAAKDEFKLALYTEKENPNKANVFIVFIDAEFNGKRVFVKTMSPAIAPENQNAHALAIDAAIQFYLSQY